MNYHPHLMYNCGRCGKHYNSFKERFDHLLLDCSEEEQQQQQQQQNQQVQSSNSSSSSSKDNRVLTLSFDDANESSEEQELLDMHASVQDQILNTPAPVQDETLNDHDDDVSSLMEDDQLDSNFFESNVDDQQQEQGEEITTCTVSSTSHVFPEHVSSSSTSNEIPSTLNVSNSPPSNLAVVYPQQQQQQQQICNDQSNSLPSNLRVFHPQQQQQQISHSLPDIAFPSCHFESAATGFQPQQMQQFQEQLHAYQDLEYPRIQYQDQYYEQQRYQDHSDSLQIKLLSEYACAPLKHSANAAGFDLCSARYVVIHAYCCEAVYTDLQIKPPKGHYARIASRSGLALQERVLVGGGVIDPDYRGNVGVILFNFSDTDFIVNVGDRIAQLICEKFSSPNFVVVQQLDQTTRQYSGFGSTGMQ